MNSTILPPLPFPPSVNTYWRSTVIKGAVRVLISKKGRKYRSDVLSLLGMVRNPTGARLAVKITVYPPDKRTRDLDNLPKAILDAMTHAGFWHDDSQIDDLRIVRKEVIKGGAVDVTVTEITEGVAL
jgi:crossover junction endodeoxyribonuclease RusA